MSIDNHHGRNRQAVIRELAHQAAAHPRIEAAVLGAIRAELPGVIEDLLRQSYPGEELRFYVPSRGGRDVKRERDLRIRALASPPASMAPAAIAAQENLSIRRIQQILARNFPP